MLRVYRKMGQEEKENGSGYYFYPYCLMRRISIQGEKKDDFNRFLDAINSFFSEPMDNFLQTNIKNKNKKKRLYCLSWIVLHFCAIFYQDEQEHNGKLINFLKDQKVKVLDLEHKKLIESPFGLEADETHIELEYKNYLQAYGWGLHFNRDTGRNAHDDLSEYQLDSIKFGKKFLCECFDCLIEKKFAYRNDGDKIKGTRALIFPSFKRMYEFFKANRKLIDRVIEEAQAPVSLVSVRVPEVPQEEAEKKGKVKINWIDTNIENLNLSTSNKEYIKKSEAYVARVQKAYSQTKFSIASEFPERKDDSVCSDILNNFGKLNGPKDNEQFNSTARSANFALIGLDGSSMYRIFHYKNENLAYGRMYGNPFDNMPSFLTPLLEIDGESTTEIDIKNANIRMWLLGCYEGDNKDEILDQDFYEFNCLKREGFNREDTKFAFQCLTNNAKKRSAVSAYNFQRRKGSPTLKNQLIDEMLSEKQFLQDYFLHPEVSDKCTKEESDYMLAVIDRLLNENIKFLYHFDSIIVQTKQWKRTYEIMEEEAMKKWERRILLNRTSLIEGKEDLC